MCSRVASAPRQDARKPASLTAACESLSSLRWAGVHHLEISQGIRTGHHAEGLLRPGPRRPVLSRPATVSGTWLREPAARGQEAGRRGGPLPGWADGRADGCLLTSLLRAAR